MASFDSMAEELGIIIPSNPKDREAIRASLDEISNVMTKIDSGRDFISEEIKAMAEKYSLPAKFLRKMASAYYKQTFSKEKKEAEDFEALYETIIGE